jgi:hypothetical protein
MRFLRLICAGRMREQTPQYDAEKDFKERSELGYALRTTSQLVECSRLLPHATSTLRTRRRKVSTTDGPYAETKG